MKTPSVLTRRQFLRSSAVTALTAPGLLTAAPAGEPKAPADGPLKVAVVTGGHPYDVQDFHRLFRSLAGMDAYIQHMDDFATSSEAVRDGYDVVVLYIMLTEGPGDEKEKLPLYAGNRKAVLEHLGATNQGIVVLHHALLAYPNWPVWSELVGIANRKFWFYHDQHIQVKIANPGHPITQGLHDWEMTDETYTMANAGVGSDILLTLDHPKSMKTIGWTRQFKQARVFCLESGHDNQAWANANFREVLRRGIQWCARRIG